MPTHTQVTLQYELGVMKVMLGKLSETAHGPQNGFPGGRANSIRVQIAAIKVQLTNVRNLAREIDRNKKNWWHWSMWRWSLRKAKVR